MPAGRTEGHSQHNGSALETGDLVAGYRIKSLLGQGGMATVYCAEDVGFERLVALKVLSRTFSGDECFVERFRHEGRLQAAIDHPHILPIYGAGQVEGDLYLALRLVQGPSLKQLIVAGEVDPHRSLDILDQVAGALDAAHAVGLIHRDIKPHNVLIEGGDHAYLTDFGLAKDLNGEGLTTAGQFIGTIDYVAPEQAMGEAVTAQTDVYQLAGVLFECLTGHVPYVRPTEAAVLFAHLTAPPPSLAESRPDLPAALGGVLARGMAKDPGDRYHSATELIREARESLDAVTSLSA